ncbi:MAG: hypothetical protein LUC43_00455 [Burkholderiales bacterium]|nr:hypothetical protein [Burkholderiales bacterium]
MNKPLKNITTTLFVTVMAALLQSTPTYAAEEPSALDTTLPATKVPEWGFSPEETKEAEEGPIETTGTYNRWFPIFGQWAVDHGADLPSPFGIQLNYIDIRQGINVEALSFGGLSGTSLINTFLTDEVLKSTTDNTYNIIANVLKEYAPDLSQYASAKTLEFLFKYSPDTVRTLATQLVDSIDLGSLFDIDVGKTRQKSHTDSIRLDAWVFPFLNIYGMYGRTRGHTNSVVNVGSSVPLIDSLLKNYVGQNIGYELDLKGNTWGLGAVLAGGYKNVFASLDFNYSWTRLNVVHGNIDAFVFEPRVGYQFHLPGWQKIYWPESTLSVWLGAMYQDVKQSFGGNLSNLKFTGNLQTLDNLLNPGDESFHVEQRLKNPWNMLAGFRWDVGKHFAVTAEWGFIHRNSFMIAVEGRF